MSMSCLSADKYLNIVFTTCTSYVEWSCTSIRIGVLLSHDMSWSNHIHSRPTNIATKAHQKLCFLRRNLKGSLLDCKKLAYVALVRSALEYASIMGSIFRRTWTVLNEFSERLPAVGSLLPTTGSL